MAYAIIPTLQGLFQWMPVAELITKYVLEEPPLTNQSTPDIYDP